MKKLVLLPLVFVAVLAFWSCNNTEPERSQTIVSGKLEVLVDETLLPVMEEQVAVFEHLYDRTEVGLSSAQENQVIAKLLNKEVEVVVLARQLTAQENEFFKTRDFVPRVYRFATDAVALVVNKATPDTVISVADLRALMQGRPPVGSLRNLVFDNANSSTLRLLKSIANVDSLPEKGVYALKSSQDVLKYINETPQAVGVLGISWVVRPDSKLKRYIEGIKVLAVSGQEGPTGESFPHRPSQSNLADSVYALSRPVYIVNAEPRKSLGMGFAAFLTGEAGQRVILKSGLLPDTMPPRELIIR